ncbi:MAG TPA: Stp1/IreP family PP2C-type Ser/Thr phosphatase [Pyrinomonadaceae bacterium]|nr:Stp1/IreP family PP2C-type Ser/Thr phosphatase [Pyrinomonadaceae bacterium]
MTEDPTGVRLSAAAVTDRGLNEKRPENEDSMLSDPAHRIFAVADGVGGAQAGEVASQTAIEVLQEAFANQHDDEDVEDLMEIAIQRANDSIYRMSREQPRFAMMATTIVALHLNGLRATVGHVGDSRLYSLSPSGQLKRETEDHSLVEEEMRAGRLTPEQAANHPGRNVISRALGAESAVEVDMRSFEFESGTTFLLCSDGITRHIPDRELSTLLRDAQSLEAACEEMKRRCYERGAEDNLTAVVVRVGAADAGRAAAAGSIHETETDDEQTLVRERPHDLHAAPTLPDTPSLLRRPFDSAGAGVAVAAPADAKPVASAPPVESSANATHVTGDKADAAEPRRGSGRGALVLGMLILAVGAAAIAFYLGIRFEQKGMSKQIGLAAPATPTPVPSPTVAASPPDSPADRFEQRRRAVDLAPASEAARMAAEANGRPLDSTDPEFLYLYGRAMLLSDRQTEAADAFDRAILKINENMTPANGELKIDARLAKVAAHLRANDEAAARAAADALSEVVRPQAPPGEGGTASPSATSSP